MKSERERERERNVSSCIERPEERRIEPIWRISKSVHSNIINTKSKRIEISTRRKRGSSGGVRIVHGTFVRSNRKNEINMKIQKHAETGLSKLSTSTSISTCETVVRDSGC